MTVAEVGNIVEFYDGLRGRVRKLMTILLL